MTFSLLTWCLWSCPEPEQSWTFPKKTWTSPGRPYYYILCFQKLIESPPTVRQKAERDIPGPRETLEGKSCLQTPFSSWRLLRGHIGPPGQPLVRKSCLAGSSLIPWPCHGLGTPLAPNTREGNGNSLQHSCLENSMGTGAWRDYSPRGHKEWDMTEWLSLSFCSLDLLKGKVFSVVICKCFLQIQLNGFVSWNCSQDIDLGFIHLWTKLLCFLWWW